MGCARALLKIKKGKVGHIQFSRGAVRGLGVPFL